MSVKVDHKFNMNVQDKEDILGLVPVFDYGEFGKITFYRTYSRQKPDGSMETWNDVVIRCVEGVLTLRKDHYFKAGLYWDRDFWQHYTKGMALSLFRMEWLPPGRGLWAMGTDFIHERGSMALNNCGFTNITDNIGDDVHWAMDALMCGVGVGFDPIRNDRLSVYNPKESYEFVIPDSREGWCDSVRALCNSFLIEQCKKPVFIYDEIRPMGLPIKGFGGLASGPEPLKILHEQIETFFNNFACESWYDSVLLKSDIMNCIGSCVVAGNVRRSAEIACGEISDNTFLNLKDESKYPYRSGWSWMSNNSAKLREDEDFELLGEIAERVKIKGEPGIINVKNMKFGRVGRSMENLRYDAAENFNPCLRFSDKVLTPNGLKNAGDLIEGDVIWSKEGWTKILDFWSNGLKQVFRYKTTSGHIDLTANHRIVENGEKVEVALASSIDLCQGVVSNFERDLQSIVDGLVTGDGGHFGGGERNVGRLCLYVGEDDQDYFESEIKEFIGVRIGDKKSYEVKTTIFDVPVTYERQVPDKYLYGSSVKVKSFLRGLYSANGSVVNGRITLKTASSELRQQVQVMLSSVGIRSYYTTNKEHDVQHHNGIYTSKESYDINIQDLKSREIFILQIGFLQKYKVNKVIDSVSKVKQTWSTKSADIFEREYIGEEEVFDLTVDNESHTFWCNGFDVSNCGEQPLEDKELCTLVETCPTKCKDEQTWLKACEYATVYGSSVTLLPTHRWETNSVMQRNRRIGVGIIDYTGWCAERGPHIVTKLLRQGYDRVRSVNKWVNSEAGIPESIRVTTMKPGGTTPKLVGRVSGAGYPNFHIEIRRIRIATNAHLAKLMIEAGIPYELDVKSMNTYVFEYPLKTNSKAKCASEVTLWEQAFNLITLQREWSDNAVSNTLNFKPKWALKRVIEEGEADQLSEWTLKTRIALSFKTRFNSQNEKWKIEYCSPEWPGDKNKVKIYAFDPKHEEEDIKSVLAAIAPHIKSASLLPHTEEGVYPQMPESGITEEEFNERISSIRPIDWSKLRLSDSTPEMYCTGEKCELPVA